MFRARVCLSEIHVSEEPATVNTASHPTAVDWGSVAAVRAPTCHFEALGVFFLDFWLTDVLFGL